MAKKTVWIVHARTTASLSLWQHIHSSVMNTAVPRMAAIDHYRAMVSIRPLVFTIAFLINLLVALF